MKTLFATVALAATVVAFPALAESQIGCQFEDPINSSLKLSNCHRDSFTGQRIVRTMPAYRGTRAFAFAPSGPLVLRRGMSNDINSLQNETKLEGGKD